MRASQTMWHRFLTGGAAGAPRFTLLLAVAAALIVESATVMAQCPDPPSDLILVTEMANDGSNTFVELYNPGVAEVNFTGWWICINPDFAYAPIAIDESDALAAGGVLVLQLGGELDENHADRLIVTGPVDLTMGDFALYFSTEFFPDFESPDDIRDYLQWGASGQNREEQGNDACLWTTGDFIPAPLSGSAFQLDGEAVGGELTNSTDYAVHSFALNNLGIFPPPPPTATGDADGDEDVDLDDVAAFQDCNPAPETPADSTTCTPYFDFDGDSDVDWVDFAALQIAFTGPPVPVALTISGPDQVAEDSTADYSATVTYTLGPPETLTDTVAWSVVPQTYANIDTVGVLTTLEVDGDQAATVMAAFAFEGTLVEDTLTITITDETEAPEPVDGTIAITELAGDGTNTYVELYNTGDFEISLTDWWLCLNPGLKYEEIAVESCDVLGGREVLVIQLGGTLDSSVADHAITISPTTLDVGDIGLYVGEDFLIFSDSDSIREYLQWGAAGQTRESVGADAGLWNAGTYVDGSLADGSVQLLEAAVDLPLTEIDSLFVTPFSQHSLGVFPKPEPSSDDDPDENDDSETPDEDDQDDDSESPDEDPSDPSDDNGEAASGPGDDDPVPGDDDPEPPAEDEVPITTGSSNPTRGGLCGLFGMVNLLTLITGLAMLKRVGVAPASCQYCPGFSDTHRTPDT